jgi:adenylylsulfate kinase
MSPGFTLWFTGLSGAGKSTLARAIRDGIVARGRRVEILDGDEVRTTLSKGLGFSKEDRDTNIQRIGYVARLLSRNGVVAIVAAVSPYRGVRDEVRRAHEAPFVETFVACSLDELVRGTGKGSMRRRCGGDRTFYGSVRSVRTAAGSGDSPPHGCESIDESRSSILIWLEQQGLLGTPLIVGSNDAPSGR